MQQHLERPLILHLQHVTVKDCADPVRVSIILNTMVDALNQVLPGRGSYAITDDGRIVVRDGLRESVGRDEHVPLDDESGVSNDPGYGSRLEEHCRVCNTVIHVGELCADCAKRLANDPFTSEADQ